jgi:hypothetical protein
LLLAPQASSAAFIEVRSQSEIVKALRCLVDLEFARHERPMYRKKAFGSAS